MKLSVIITTYNQAEFVEESIASVLNQETNFDFEIIIADDNSTDNTAEIIYKICEQDGRITFLDNDKNIGISKNYAQCLKLAKGEFIADIAGDDVWTDKFKLQKEVSFLETNPQYGMVHTQYDILLEDRKKRIKNVQKNPIFGDDVFETLLVGNSICSITACYRKQLIISLIENLESNVFGFEDLPLWLEIAQKSGVGYLADSTALYRVLKESASHSDSYEKMKKYHLQVVAIVDYFLNAYSVSDDTLREVKQQEYIKTCCLEYEAGNTALFSECYKQLDYKPKRVVLMNILLKNKTFYKLFSYFRINLINQY